MLLQPATGRIALIDLPYARALPRFGARHRVRDLAILSLELRRFLSAAEWEDFLARYRAAARELGARDADAVGAERDRARRRARRAPHRGVVDAQAGRSAASGTRGSANG